MDHDVVIEQVPERPTLVVAATTTWQQFPALWRELSGEVWGCLRAAGITSGCRNVMLYLDDTPRVEVGVLLDRPCPPTGRVVVSRLPAGTAVTTVHRGSFADLAAAHDAVVEWCAANGWRRSGTRWEIYGPHSDDPAQQWTRVSWLVTPEGQAGG